MWKTISTFKKFYNTSIYRFFSSKVQFDQGNIPLKTVLWWLREILLNVRVQRCNMSKLDLLLGSREKIPKLPYFYVLHHVSHRKHSIIFVFVVIVTSRGVRHQEHTVCPLCVSFSFSKLICYIMSRITILINYLLLVHTIVQAVYYILYPI